MKEGRWLEDMIGGFEPRLPSGTFPEGIQCSELMAAVLKAARSCAGLSHFFNRSLQPGRTDLAPGRLRSDVWPCPPLGGVDGHSLALFLLADGGESGSWR